MSEKSKEILLWVLELACLMGALYLLVFPSPAGSASAFVTRFAALIVGGFLFNVYLWIGYWRGAEYLLTWGLN
jgi:hypothetical protein